MPRHAYANAKLQMEWEVQNYKLNMEFFISLNMYMYRRAPFLCAVKAQNVKTYLSK